MTGGQTLWAAGGLAAAGLVGAWVVRCYVLRPLRRLTACVRAALDTSGDTTGGGECPRLDWRGRGAFADLVAAVNALIETISRRTVVLSQAQTRQKALIKGIPDGLLVFNFRHRLVSLVKHPDGTDPIPGLSEGFALDEAVYGRARVEAFGRALDTLFAAGGVQTLRLDTGTGRDARYFDVRLTKTDKHFALAVLRDITAYELEHRQRMAAEARLSLARKQESLTLFAGAIAHDINNVLTAVNNTLETVPPGTHDERVEDVLKTVRDAVRRGRAMTRELTTFAGETRVTFRACDPSALVREAERLLRGAVGVHVSVTYELADDLPRVDADPDQIWKVFFNLIKNAAEAMTGVGTITVRTQGFFMTDELAEEFISAAPVPAGAGVLFRIDDTGPGIKSEMLRRIFDPYVSTKSEGRGFGLATVASIVDAHHGGIRVSSVVGSGSSFDVYLPVTDGTAERWDGEAPRARPRTSEPDVSVPVRVRNGHDILLIDDDDTLLKTTRILLKMLNYTVHTASDHRTAMDVFRRVGPNLACVLMDANLGETDAVRLLGAFRSVLPSVPVVVSSGYTEESVRAQFAAQPFDAFLAKPYPLDDLKRALSTLPS